MVHSAVKGKEGGKACKVYTTLFTVTPGVSLVPLIVAAIIFGLD